MTKKLICILFLITIICVQFPKLNVHTICQISPTKIVVANQNYDKDIDTLTFKEYLISILITLPVLTVILILIIPHQTSKLIDAHISKKQKTKKRNKTIKKDNERL